MSFWKNLFRGIGIGLVFFIPVVLIVDLILVYGFGITGDALQLHWSQKLLVAWGLLSIMAGVNAAFDEELRE